MLESVEVGARTLDSYRGVAPDHLLEVEAGHRIVQETPALFAFCPFASGVPFETWITPKQHQPSFGLTSPAERLELAAALGAILVALDQLLHRPSYNYVLHTAPVAQEEDPDYLWHLQILPRVSTLAGMELGAGLLVNATSPEEAASLLRSEVSSEGTP